MARWHARQRRAPGSASAIGARRPSPVSVHESNCFSSYAPPGAFDAHEVSSCTSPPWGETRRLRLTRSTFASASPSRKTVGCCRGPCRSFGGSIAVGSSASSIGGFGRRRTAAANCVEKIHEQIPERRVETSVRLRAGPLCGPRGVRAGSCLLAGARKAERVSQGWRRRVRGRRDAARSVRYSRARGRTRDARSGPMVRG